MQRILSIAIVSAATCGLAAASVRGRYVEARTADVYTAQCFANGEVNQVGDLAVMGWRIDQGSWNGVALDGLSVIGVVKASGTLGAGASYPVKSVLVIDERATAEQREALRSFAQRAGGDLLQNPVKIYTEPIAFHLKDGNLHTAAASLEAGPVVKVETRALVESDKICHHEETYYPPLARLSHAMPAYTVANSYQGKGLEETWSSPGKRSAFVGSFEASETL